LTREQARAKTHRIEARLDHALQLRRFGLASGQVGVDLGGVGQIVRDFT
jgi:hypothetical protein